MSRAKEGPNTAGGLSRRSFLHGVLAAGSIAALGSVVGAAPSAGTTQTATSAGPHTWEKKPAPIPDSKIAKTITTDILVIGAGMSGMSAALTASEEGAKIVLLEKSGKPSYRGIDYGSVNCEMQKAVGIKLDPDEILMEALRWGGHRGDYRVIKAWVDHSAEAMNWMAGKLRAGGATVVPQPTDFQVIPGASYKYFPTDSFLCVPTPPVMKVAEEQGYNPYAASWAYALRPQLDKFGVQTLWNTRAHQLIRQEGGPVTGAIAQDADGKYVKILAEKGVLLCTGDYGRNDEMLRAFIPYVDDIYDVNSPANSTGDGHIMGMWAGAAIDEGPHAPMYFDEGTVGAPHAESIPVLRQPWLYLNTHGERYTNEDLPYAYVVNATNAQPNHVKWVLFDAKWPEDGPKMHMIVCKDFRCWPARSQVRRRAHRQGRDPLGELDRGAGRKDRHAEGASARQHRALQRTLRKGRGHRLRQAPDLPEQPHQGAVLRGQDRHDAARDARRAEDQRHDAGARHVGERHPAPLRRRQHLRLLLRQRVPDHPVRSEPRPRADFRSARRAARARQAPDDQRLRRPEP